METDFTGEWNFSDVLAYCNRLKQTGEIKSFLVSCESDRGRLIHVESDSGWNPEPLFEEFPAESLDPIPS
ncbi:hypothetical protein [Acidovorax sp. sic0104]|uniref:hypothetical protein n=1 Tax=Acidovorax sp. sic0104 TaxID=2854784 RepID=UPI001C485AB1|nr:hypothetical protein [Acidovorax sp. sic0104]MBV7541936.1 hypothetical protein [Acidovorax sp. sic0104]